MAALLAGAVALAQKAVSDAEVAKVHKSLLLIDSHNDVTSRTVDGFDIGPRSTESHTDIPRMREGGMGAQFFAVFVAANYVDGNRAAHRTLEMIDTVRHDIIDRYPETYQLATTADEIEAARKRGRIAALLGIEGGHAIEDSLRLLRTYHLLGVRYMTLTHSNSNNWADSSGDIEKPHNGLTTFGKDVVREMNRLGMMVDIAHVSDKTFWDALEVSRAPVFSSHSSCRALSKIPRNMTDEMIVALAKRGGLMQINFGCEFLNQKSADSSEARRPQVMKQFAALREKYKDDPKGMAAARRELFASMREGVTRATLADVVAHIDHVVKIAGVDAVGLGSDFDGVGCTPDGLDDVSKWPNLTRALLEKGYAVGDIRKIYGGNLLRVMRAVEKVAREGKAS